MDFSAPFAIEAIPGFLSGETRSGGIREWLVTGSYQISLLNSEIEILAIDKEEFCRYLAADYSRFALSSLESIAASFVQHFDNRAAAWPILNQYYSAFFSVHALLRSQGRGIIRLGDAQSNHLQQFVRASVDPNFFVANGNYEFVFEPGSTGQSKLMLRRRNPGAAHEDLWTYFHEFLGDFTNEFVTAGRVGASEFLARAEELRSILRGPQNSQGKWLSVVRNEINYQHRYGAWYPFYERDWPGTSEKHSQTA
jgi:hypothetical protein